MNVAKVVRAMQTPSQGYVIAHLKLVDLKPGDQMLASCSVISFAMAHTSYSMGERHTEKIGPSKCRL